jgi:ketosteroid isomerase-like protein
LSAGAAAAQHLTEQDGRQVVDGIEKVKAKAFETKDAAMWGSLFADNAVQLPDSGETSVGRPAIQNWFRDLMKSWEAGPNELVEVKVVNDNVIIYTGAWSGVWRGEKGPIRLSGHYSDALVHEGDGWKIVLDTVNLTPPK